MDRLKFRVWDGKTYDHKFPFNQIGLFYIGQNGNLFSDFGNAVAPEIHQDEYVVEMCTGLKDKNGNLIYENDRIKKGTATGTVRFGFYRKTDEHFPDSIYGFYIEWDKGCLFRQDFGYWATEGIEIIGNIHTATVKDGE